LIAFEKVFLKAGASTTIEYTLSERDTQEFDTNVGDFQTVDGSYTVYFGTSSRKLFGSIPFTVSSIHKPLSSRLLINDTLVTYSS